MNPKSTTALALSLFLLLPLNAFASGSISGKVTLQSRTNHSSPVTFKLNNPGETTPFKTYNITTASDGTYSLTDIPQGTYNLSAKALNSLSQTQVLIEVLDGQPASDTNFRLLGGDANGDNSVATADFGILRKAWFSNPTSPNWDPRVDFNGDKSVAAGDMVIMRSNWLKNGSEPQITITSPQDNSLTSNPTISVSGTFSSVNRIVAVIVRGTSAAVKNGAFYIDNVFLSEGKNKISAIAINKYNNKNADLITVTLDTTSPTGTININNSAQYTNSTTVTLNLSATDSISGLSRMQFSNDNIRWSVPQGYSTSRSWELTSSDGAKTVHAKFEDAAGNQSAPVSDTITLDTTVPVIAVTSPQDGFVSTTQTITVSGTIDDSYAAVTVNGTSATVSNNTFTANNIALTQGPNTITATATDPAGNSSSDSIAVNSPNLSHYELTKISGETAEDDPNRPSAGSAQILKVKLEKNNLPAPNEEIQFNIITPLPDGERAGVRGKVTPQSTFTDSNGEATATLTTDTNSDITNEVQCYLTSNPLVKTIFSVDTKPGQPAILTKITDDSITPVPTATISLIVKLTDSNNNPIQDETINFQVISGDGTLSAVDVIPAQAGIQISAVTAYYGEAKVNLTCPNLASTLTQIKVSSSTVPSLITTFNITTSALLTVTADDIIAKVNQNDSKIQDIKADITMTSNAPFLAPVTQLKIWIKGNKQKVEEISPNPGVYIRPVIEGSTMAMAKQIISSDPISNVYVVKVKEEGQTDEYPYIVHHIDYGKGVILKTEYHILQNDFETTSVSEYLDFVQIGDAWGYQRQIDKTYVGGGELIYTTTNVYSNIQMNTGIPDSEFQ